MVKISSYGLIGLLVVAMCITGYFLLKPSANEQVIASLPSKTTSGEGIRIVAFGDSLTAGYGLTSAESYPSQLQVRLQEQGIKATVINAGVSGETTRGNRERAAFIRAQNPDIVLLGIGGNDALRALSVAEAKINIEETVRVLRTGENQPVVMLLEMQAPLNGGLVYKQAFDAMYADIAEEQSLVLVPFITSGIFLDPINKLPDGIHLNKIGYGRVVDEQILEPVVEVITQLER